MALNQEQKDQIHRLLNDVAESEHHLRHPVAFLEIVARLGYELVKHPHKFEVVDPNAPKHEPEETAPSAEDPNP